MILVDTSIWVDHLRQGNRDLQGLLQNDRVLTHPFVVGELACGSLQNRTEILRLLQELPQARVAEHTEVLGFIESRHLWGKGIGWIDAHLLAAALLSRARLWTGDKQLSTVAAALRLNPTP
jgi:predicted nucleic acid-binding protein